jgi:hypothetical protein
MYSVYSLVVILRIYFVEKGGSYFSLNILAPPWPLLNAGTEASSFQQITELVSALQN